MSYKLTYLPDRLGVVVKFSGDVRAEEITQFQTQVREDKTFSAWLYVVLDFSQARDITASMDDLRTIAKRDSYTVFENPCLKIAIIPRKHAPDKLDQVFHAMQRVWGVHESKSFDDVSTALKWTEKDNRPTV